MKLNSEDLLPLSIFIGVMSPFITMLICVLFFSLSSKQFSIIYVSASISTAISFCAGLIGGCSIYKK